MRKFTGEVSLTIHSHSNVAFFAYKSPYISKYQFDLETGDEEPLRGMCHCNFLFIDYFFP